ncbi:unnamed protein product [Dovyalis caffra]|uniref:Transmembrane protein n=1 Tax=Dovyalis caffra TaxID=77055 RepID=A0AAV1QLT3_9ROSI|nr:unnamed protein product [Dovyalis caffra]
MADKTFKLTLYALLILLHLLFYSDMAAATSRPLDDHNRYPINGYRVNTHIGAWRPTIPGLHGFAHPDPLEAPSSKS